MKPNTPFSILSKFKKQLLFGVVMVGMALSCIVPSTAQAQGEAPAPPTNDYGITNPAIGNLGNSPSAATAGTTFANYFVTIWQAIIFVGGLTVLVYFLWSGISWILAADDASKVQKARDRMTQAVIGMIILVGSFVIIQLISSLFFGEEYNLLNPTFNAPNNNINTTYQG